MALLMLKTVWPFPDMKPRWQKQRNRALTIIEVLVIVAVLIILAAVILPVLAAMKRRSSAINCVACLKMDSLAFRIWEGDNNNKYPMSVSVTNGGAMELIATGNVAACFQVMSNELGTPKILICPLDRKHVAATNFTTDFNNSRISYFLSMDASEAYPQMIMSGDDNLEINDVPVKPGLVLLPGNAVISWTAERHGHAGNLSFADGSVAEESSAGLRNALVLSTNGTPITSVGIVIP
jgi:prepilin-type processing-associated H-X9-DG protein